MASISNKRRVRALTDIALTLLLLLSMGYPFWGNMPHEWLGTAMLALLILHHVLNRRWYATFFKGRYSTVRVLYAALDLLLLADALALLYSGIVISRYVFGFLETGSGMALARRLHIQGSYWGFILMSLHMGLHCDRAIGKVKARVPSRAGKTAAAILALLFAAYGVYAFLSRSFPDYLFLRSEFVFFDASESAARFYLDYLAVMASCIALSYIVKKACLRTKRDLPQK